MRGQGEDVWVSAYAVQADGMILSVRVSPAVARHLWAPISVSVLFPSPDILELVEPGLRVQCLSGWA